MKRVPLERSRGSRALATKTPLHCRDLLSARAPPGESAVPKDDAPTRPSNPTFSGRPTLSSSARLPRTLLLGSCRVGASGNGPVKTAQTWPRSRRNVGARRLVYPGYLARPRGGILHKNYYNTNETTFVYARSAQRGAAQVANMSTAFAIAKRLRTLFSLWQTTKGYVNQAEVRQRALPHPVMMGPRAWRSGGAVRIDRLGNTWSCGAPLTRSLSRILSFWRLLVPKES